MLGLTSCICFSSFFPKKAWIILCKTDSDPIWMEWSGFDQRHLVCEWPTTSFPLSDLVLFFRRRPGKYCAKPARIQFNSGWLCQVLGKWIQSRSKPMCKNHPARFWPMLPSWSGPDVNRIWYVYWMHMHCLVLWFSHPSTNTISHNLPTFTLHEK